MHKNLRYEGCSALLSAVVFATSFSVSSPCQGLHGEISAHSGWMHKIDLWGFTQGERQMSANCNCLFLEDEWAFESLFCVSVYCACLPLKTTAAYIGCVCLVQHTSYDILWRTNAKA